jgi:HlyD family secretion protein
MDRQIEKKKWTVKRISLIAAVGLFVLFVAYIIFSEHKSKLNVEKDKITISEVKKAQFQEFIPITGTIEPFQTFYLDLAEGGKIIEKYVQEGAWVKIGDPIIKLDNPNLSIQVMNTQSSFLTAESQLRLARLTFEQNRLSKESQLLSINVQLASQKRKYELNKSLYEKGLGTKFEYEDSKDLYESLMRNKELMMEVLKQDSLTNVQMLEQNKSNLELSKTCLQLIQNQQASLTVKAPIKGQLTSLVAEIGQSVTSGYKLGQIDNTDSYKIRAEIDEHYISKVHEGLAGEYEFNNTKYVLTIKTVYPQVVNGRFYADLVFSGKQPDGIRRGQTVHVKLQLGDLSEALLVENGGFFSTTGGQWIFVLDKSESFAEKRQIKIGRQNPLYFELLDGLKEGEKVITSSYDNYGDIEKLIIK